MRFGFNAIGVKGKLFSFISSEGPPSIGKGEKFPFSNRHEVSSRTPFVRDLLILERGLRPLSNFSPKAKGKKWFSYPVISSEARNLLSSIETGNRQLRTFPKRDLKFFGWSSRRVSSPPRFKEETPRKDSSGWQGERRSLLAKTARGDKYWEGDTPSQLTVFWSSWAKRRISHYWEGDTPSQLTPKGKNSFWVELEEGTFPSSND